MSGAPDLASTASKSAATSLASAALHLWTCAPVSLASAASLSVVREAIVTLRPFFANSRASEALRPGPVPTIRADVYLGFSIGAASLFGWGQKCKLEQLPGKEMPWTLSHPSPVS